MILMLRHLWCSVVRGHEYCIVTEIENKLILLECRCCRMIAEIRIYPPMKEV